MTTSRACVRYFKVWEIDHNQNQEILKHVNAFQLNQQYTRHSSFILEFAATVAFLLSKNEALYWHSQQQIWIKGIYYIWQQNNQLFLFLYNNLQMPFSLKHSSEYEKCSPHVLKKIRIPLVHIYWTSRWVPFWYQHFDSLTILVCLAFPY